MLRRLHPHLLLQLLVMGWRDPVLLQVLLPYAAPVVAVLRPRQFLECLAVVLTCALPSVGGAQQQ
jgi:hypothetical protein